jgi:protein-S-isoprenylcysteine O-methyltransferase Ste14
MPEDPGKLKPAISAILRLVLGIVIIGVLFFLPAGTLDYWQAWMWLGTLLTPMIFALIYLAKRDPALLERRSRMNETRPEQKRIIAASTLYFLVAFLLPGFDKRFGWSHVPAWVSIAADAGVLAAYLFFFLVMKTNSYASRVVEVQQGQQVITAGPYALVRHPMYLAMILMMALSPLALGSYWAAVPSIALIFLLAARIKSEEELLIRELAGYREYTQKTRYRLIPGVW